MTRDHAIALDNADKLMFLRDFFELPEDLIHLDANSVGPMPKATRDAAKGLLADWVTLRRRGWAERQWLDMPSLLGDAIAPMIGARKGEVIMCDSTTLNQFKAVAHALSINANRNAIVTQSGNFPTDLHVLEGLKHVISRDLRVIFCASEDEAIAALNEDVAVAALSHVDYRSGERWDMERVTKFAHDKGVLTVWDVSHSAGAVPVDVRGSDPDFVIGCGYKYLCSGPGGPAFIYARPGLADRAHPAIAGWMGHADVFAFAAKYEPHPGIKRFLTGTPLVGANELAKPLLDIWPKVDPQALWAKHNSLTDYLIALLKSECGPLGVTVTSPEDHGRRGGNVSFSSPGAGSVVEALLDQGVISSFRKPDAIRFGVSPLVIRHVDIHDAVERLKHVLEIEIWKQPKYAKVAV
jgi:kynureninase